MSVQISFCNNAYSENRNKLDTPSVWILLDCSTSTAALSKLLNHTNNCSHGSTSITIDQLFGRIEWVSCHRPKHDRNMFEVYRGRILKLLSPEIIVDIFKKTSQTPSDTIFFFSLIMWVSSTRIFQILIS